jgi:outer membrane PBP1 activator LpoA protein
MTYYGITAPLFTLSSAWEPTADAAALQDLEGLGFCGLPWLLEDATPAQQSALQCAATPHGQS